MFGAVIKAQNKTIVIDGGCMGDHRQLNSFLLENCNAHVDAWFFTHPHHDHMGAFCELHKTCANIAIERIFHAFPPFELLFEQGMRWEKEKELLQELKSIFETMYPNRVHTLQRGDVFRFGDVQIRILRTFNEKITQNFVNNSSTVFRIDSGKSSILILGDLGVEGGEEVLEICSKDELQTEYTQMAHHDQSGVSESFYRRIKPQRCIWPTPIWLWENDAGNGYNSGPWETLKTRRWMSEMGVKEHIIEKDGTQIIEL